YLRGFRDAADTLYERARRPPSEDAETEAVPAYADTPSLTWGLQATKVNTSKYSGQGIRVAVLDTGLFLAHPDFIGRRVVSKSFISG
ncbi:hypothetical protein JBO09_28035, partial [Pseudomonas sp. PAMC 26818]|nr:hypothetical protein [Pseudomonas sp. PAMC 26818]